MSEVKNARVVIPYALSDVPNGEWEGVWSDYIVNVMISGEWFELETVNGVRGIDIPCIVKVRDGNIKVKVK